MNNNEYIPKCYILIIIYEKEKRFYKIYIMYMRSHYQIIYKFI